MSAVAHAGRTVLFVSHNMAAVEKLCGNCCLLQDGKIVKTGRTPEVIHAYMQQTVMAPQNLLSRNDRNGNGVLRFTGFTLRDSRQNLLPSFRTGSTAIFEISFINPGDMPLRNVSISLGIDNLMGERIAVLDNEMTNQIFGVIARSVKSILIEVPNLPLLPGRYGVTLFAKAGSEIADWVQNAGSFDVDSGDFFGTGRLATGQGHIAIAHSFRLQT
jgi:lipopolysaccharide transport system ATP-binding protein